MKKKSNKIVFFGSGPVAAKSLGLLKDSFQIEAVITKSSTKKLMQDVVSETTVFCANSKKELDNLIDEENLSSKVAILIDFGIIVSQRVIESFALGIINSHFSLLPELRGADPITFSLLSGQSKTGVSLMLLSAGMDEGLILAQSDYKIKKTTDSSILTADLIDLSDGLLKACLSEYMDGKIIPIDQVSAAEMMGLSPIPTYSRKLTKEDGLIDWSKDAVELEREIRAYREWPKSYTNIKGIDLIIRQADVVNASGSPGEYRSDKKSLLIFCGKEALDIKVLQPAGKKEMPVSAFLNGHSL